MRLLVVNIAVVISIGAARVQAAPTPSQLCESAIELASAKFAQCRLTAESKFSKTGDAARRSAALAKCSQRLSDGFSKASIKYGSNCAATEPSSAFDDYLKQCSDDAAAGAAGAALPDYVGDLASCSGDLAACNSDLSACLGGLPPARLLKTDQTTSYGAGSDGDLQTGIGRGYVDNGDGTITDTKTGLTWEKKSDDGSLHDKDNWYGWGSNLPPYAMHGTMLTTFLAGLNAGGGFAGYTDWRVPNIFELYSLVSLQTFGNAIAPAFNAGCIPGCTVTTCSCTGMSGVYWSSSTLPLDPSRAFNVFFWSGGMGDHSKTDSNYVRAVRGGS